MTEEAEQQRARVEDALQQIRIAMAYAQSFADALEDDELWRQRARVHGRLRTWWLRWHLRHMRRKERNT